MDRFVNLDDALAGLNDAQQKELYARLAFKYGAADGTFDRQATDSWEIICAVTLSRRPLAEFARSFGRNRLLTAIADMNHYIEAASGVALTPPLRMALLRCVLGCVAAHLDARAIPVTPTVLLNSMVLLPSAVEQRFPGYAGARLLHLVVAMARPASDNPVEEMEAA